MSVCLHPYTCGQHPAVEHMIEPQSPTLLAFSYIRPMLRTGAHRTLKLAQYISHNTHNDTPVVAWLGRFGLCPNNLTSTGTCVPSNDEVPACPSTPSIDIMHTADFPLFHKFVHNMPPPVVLRRWSLGLHSSSRLRRNLSGALRSHCPLILSFYPYTPLSTSSSNAFPNIANR